MTKRAYILSALAVAAEAVIAARQPDLIHGTLEPTISAASAGSIWVLAIGLSCYLHGRWARDGYARRVLSLGMLGFAACLWVVTRARTPEEFVALRFSEGTAFGAVLAGARVLGGLELRALPVIALFGALFARYYGLLLFKLGFLVDPVSARLVVNCFAVICALAAPWGGWRRGESIAPESRALTPRWAHAAASAGGFVLAAAGTVWPVFAFFAYRLESEPWVGTFAAAAAVGVVLAALFGRRDSRPIAWSSWTLIAVLCLAPCLLGSDEWVGMLGAGLAGLAIGILVDLARRMPHTGILFSCFVGALTGPLLTGLAAQSYGAIGAFALWALIGWAAGLAAWDWSRPSAADPSAAPARTGVEKRRPLA